MQGKSCVQCGECDPQKLQLDHIDMNGKATEHDHKIWSWSKERREAEIAKCQVLCKDCHAKKTLGDIQKYYAQERAKKTPLPPIIPDDYQVTTITPPAGSDDIPF